ncbi:hypothetical protein FHP25_14825 [Vineibacter terrae]|uniref:Solute-binding protein family 5 domain-containing protein n=1 Tax=Vineibacter terrae TaxID=2586908 RepID=A0A5C8PLT5_9HYPH|nr:ABC transporter substrate-binding protein [Vineibacter terrae]TXL75153.1 hypothetical protein FHP25_14825 [Vineibacter terrae]
MMFPKNCWLRSTAVGMCIAAAALAATPGWAQKRGGTLIVGSEAEFNGFNPIKVKGMNSNTLAPSLTVMEGLFAYGNDQTIEPRLGLELKDAPDHKSATVTLRQGVTFHDGTPFNADAVIFHYRRVLDPQNSISAASMLSPIESVEAVDAYTVRFNLKHPWAALKSALALDSVINLIGSPKALTDDPDGFQRKPIGTGPYVFDEWRTGDRVIVSRNENYWDKDRPYLDRIIFRIVPDQVTLHQSVKSGEIHMALGNTAQPVVDAREAPNLQIIDYVGGSTTGWGLNQSKPPFNDLRARRAIIAAFDSQAFADGYFMGTVKVADGIFAPNSPWYCGGSNGWRGYDLPAAKALLKEIGKPVQLTMNSTNTPGGRRLASISQQFAQAAGFQAKIKLVDQAQHVRNFYANDFQMASWRPQIPDGDPDHMVSLMYSTEGARTVSKYSSAKMDALIQQGRTETDTTKRKKIYCEIERLVSDDAILIMPIRLVSHMIAGKKVKNVPAPRGNIVLVRDIWLDDSSGN